MSDNIRELCYVWSKMTYIECWMMIRDDEKDDQLIDAVDDYLFNFNGYNRNILGYDIQDLPRNYEVEKSNKIFFSKIYRDIEDRLYFLPALYIVGVFRELIKNKISSKYYTVWMGRALRSFASFLREDDLKNQLLPKLKVKDPNVQIISNAELDKNEHTDLLVKYNGNEYSIWSYLSSYYGLKNLKEKLNGERAGKIRDGVNILVPVNTSDIITKVGKKEEKIRIEIDKGDNICGWFFTPEKEVNKLCEKLDSLNQIKDKDYKNGKDGIKELLENNELDKSDLMKILSFEKRPEDDWPF